MAENPRDVGFDMDATAAKIAAQLLPLEVTDLVAVVNRDLEVVACVAYDMSEALFAEKMRRKIEADYEPIHPGHLV